jgi:hypothetical protein
MDAPPEIAQAALPLEAGTLRRTVPGMPRIRAAPEPSRRHFALEAGEDP